MTLRRTPMGLSHVWLRLNRLIHSGFLFTQAPPLNLPPPNKRSWRTESKETKTIKSIENIMSILMHPKDKVAGASRITLCRKQHAPCAMPCTWVRSCSPYVNGCTSTLQQTQRYLSNHRPQPPNRPTPLNSLLPR